VLGALLGIALVIIVTGAWGLVVTLFVLAVIAVSLTRVNYGLAVVFITPLVLVLLNVSHPGQWGVADTRVINTLLGAAIGLLVTTAILPGSERGSVVDHSQIALGRIAAFLRAIAIDSAPERLGARRAARTGTDHVMAVIDRAINEPTPLDHPQLRAATRMATATEEMWERAAELELAVAPERMTTGLRRLTNATADQLDKTVTLLSSERPRTPDSPASPSIKPFSRQNTLTSEQPRLAELGESLQSVQSAAPELGQSTHLVRRRGI